MQKPTDLQTIKMKLYNLKYIDYNEFANDIRNMFNYIKTTRNSREMYFIINL